MKRNRGGKWIAEKHVIELLEATLDSSWKDINKTGKVDKTESKEVRKNMNKMGIADDMTKEADIE